MIERLNVFIADLRISVREFERTIAASEGTIRLAIKKNSDIQAKWLVAIAKNYPQLDIYWLLTGEGEMLRGGTVQVSGSGNAVVGNSHNSTATVNATPTDTSDLRAMVEEQRTIIESLQGQLQEKDKQIAQLLAIISKK